MKMQKYMTLLSLMTIASGSKDEDISVLEVIDLTQPTTTANIVEHYGAIEKRWKICINCGIPGLGTAMHLEHEVSATSSMYPAVIPTEYLITRLAVIDVSSLTKLDPTLVLTKDVALQWLVLKHDPQEPTLLLFKFGWRAEQTNKMRSCVCKVPGVSYELAEWIAANLTHVVGVATDAPTLESEQTREFSSRTVANVLGKSGIYMIENVNARRRLPERGCMSIAMPLKLLHTSYVPSRLTAICPSQPSGEHVVLALRSTSTKPHILPSRTHDVDLDDILNN